jgi:hypothetical protein
LGLSEYTLEGLLAEAVFYPQEQYGYLLFVPVMGLIQSRSSATAWPLTKRKIISQTV